jgi:hypothetical protein
VAGFSFGPWEATLSARPRGAGAVGLISDLAGGHLGRRDGGGLGLGFGAHRVEAAVVGEAAGADFAAHLHGDLVDPLGEGLLAGRRVEVQVGDLDGGGGGVGAGGDRQGGRVARASEAAAAMEVVLNMVWSL